MRKIFFRTIGLSQIVILNLIQNPEVPGCPVVIHGIVDPIRSGMTGVEVRDINAKLVIKCI